MKKGRTRKVFPGKSYNKTILGQTFYFHDMQVKECKLLKQVIQKVLNYNTKVELIKLLWNGQEITLLITFKTF